MLLYFKFKNFKSFKDETIIDLRPGRVTELPEHVLKQGTNEALALTAIYGANASGKSNVIEAFRFMTYYVLRSFEFGDDKEFALNLVKNMRYAFDKHSHKEESTFEVFFTLPGKNESIYNYGFIIGKNANITEEWLIKNINGKDSHLISRKGKKVDLTSELNKYDKNIDLSIDDNVLVLSLGAKLKISLLKEIRDWFALNQFLDYGDDGEVYQQCRHISDDFIENESYRKDVIKFLNSFDNSISTFKVEEGNNKRRVNLFSVHAGDDNELYDLPFRNESQGTQKMFNIFPVLKKAIDNGSVLVIDELSSKLHPLLVRNILLTFIDKKSNPNNAQLIFSLHDSWHLNNDMLRRDEIWFTEKNNNVTVCYSLVDFKADDKKIRKDEDWEKNYLLGKYGAIPELKKIDF